MKEILLTEKEMVFLVLIYFIDVLNIFLSRCNELNIPETLTTNIMRILQNVHFIYTRILNIIINQHPNQDTLKLQ